MGKLNSTFLELHGDKVDAISHDVAYNPKVVDGSFFPLARHMSWFDGHSFVSISREKDTELFPNLKTHETLPLLRHNK